MNKTAVVALLLVGLLFVAGCGSGATGAVPRAPSAPSGGGCGIAAPAQGAVDTAVVAESIDAGSAL
jgi:hypothetical protein